MMNGNMNGITVGLNNTGITKGSTSTYTTTANSAGLINGKHVTALASGSNVATPTLDAAIGLAFQPMAANKATVLVLGQNAAGAIKMCQGQVVDTEVGVTTTVGAFKLAPQFPALPDDFMVFGYLLVRTAPDAAAWTAGTSSWTASGVTASAVQACGALPSRPQTA